MEVERFEHFVTANETGGDGKVAVLLSVTGQWKNLFILTSGSKLKWPAAQESSLFFHLHSQSLVETSAADSSGKGTYSDVWMCDGCVNTQMFPNKFNILAWEHENMPATSFCVSIVFCTHTVVK